MPISIVDVSKTDQNNDPLYFSSGFIRANIDKESAARLPFPKDYSFFPCYLLKKYSEIADQIYDFDVRSDDVLVVSIPKAGSTWISNIVWLLRNNLDFSSQFLLESSYILELAMYLESNDANKDDPEFQMFVKLFDDQLDRLKKEKSPRQLKSHLPPHLLPMDIWKVKPKLIYVYRNAKDVAISAFHMLRGSKMSKYTKNLEGFLDRFLDDEVPYAPFYAHIKAFQQIEHLDHLLLINYEETVANPFAVIKRISDFLNCSYSDDQLKRLTEHVSFANMRKNFLDLGLYESDYNFFRKGKAKGYLDEMSPEYIRKFDEWERQQWS